MHGGRWTHRCLRRAGGSEPGGRRRRPAPDMADTGSCGGFLPAPPGGLALRPAELESGCRDVCSSWQPLVWSDLCPRSTLRCGLPRSGPPAAPGWLSDEREINSGLGASCARQAQGPRLCPPPSRPSHLWGEGRLRALMKPPAVPAAGRALCVCSCVCAPVCAVHTSSFDCLQDHSCIWAEAH